MDDLDDKLKKINDTISKKNKKEAEIEKNRSKKEINHWQKAMDLWAKYFDCESFKKDLQKILLTFENTKSFDQNNNKIDYKWSFEPINLDIQDREKQVRFYIKDEIIELQIFWGIYDEKIEFHLNNYKLDPPDILSEKYNKRNLAYKKSIEDLKKGEDFDKAMIKRLGFDAIGFMGENLEKKRTFDLDLSVEAKKNFIEEILKTFERQNGID
jgi:hypothetical protein